MKKTLVISVTLSLILAIGIFIGWWANSPSFDLLCSSPAIFELGKNIEGEGISIKAGTQISLRSCEYANRFSVELYSEKGNYPELFIPLNSATNIGNHGADQYNVSITKE